MKTAIAFLLFSTISVAQNMTAETRDDGYRLLKECGQTVREMDSNPAHPASHYSDGRCLGYVTGFIEGVQAMGMFGTASDSEYEANRPMCFPDESTYGQDVRILVTWLTDHPELLHLDAGVLTFRALSEAYTCPGSGKKKASTKK